MKIRLQALAVVAALPLLTACGEVQAKMAFKDGNKAYKEEKYKEAIAEYEQAIAHEPCMAEAHFYLASSHQAMYRPGKDNPEYREAETKAAWEAIDRFFAKTLQGK